MNKLSTPLLLLLAPFAPCFNKPDCTKHSVSSLLPGSVCLGRRTISRVWQTTGLADQADHSSFYRFFNQAVWNWDELFASSSWSNSSGSLFPAPRSGSWSMIPSVTNGVPRSLLAASSSMPSSDPANTRSSAASGLTGLPWDSWSNCLFARIAASASTCSGSIYSKEVKGLPHQTKSQLAHEQMVDLLAIWLPELEHFISVADSATISGAKLLRDLPANVQAVGPIHPKANLDVLPASTPQERSQERRGGCPPRPK